MTTNPPEIPDGSAVARRREYSRGYASGRRNVPWSRLRHSQSADRGWAAAQARLLNGPNFRKGSNGHQDPAVGRTKARNRVRCVCMEHVSPWVKYCRKSGMECDEQDRGGCIEMSRNVRTNAPPSSATEAKHV